MILPSVPSKALANSTVLGVCNHDYSAMYMYMYIINVNDDKVENYYSNKTWSKDHLHNAINYRLLILIK